MNIKTTVKFWLGSAALLLLATPVWADIFVDRAIVRMEAGQSPREDVKVINNGSETGYVQIDVFEVHNPGTPEEERLKIPVPETMKLIASPSKLMSPANSQKMVRIVNLEPGSAEERIYRINVTPVLAPLEESESSVVRVVVAYQLLVIVDPAQPEEKVDIVRSGYRLTITNNGNTNVLFSDGKQCAADDENDCVEIAAHRVYPGRTWQTDLEKDQPVVFKLTSYKGIREVTTQ